MAESRPISETVGLTLLDAIALMTGTAVGSIHVRPILLPALAGESWVLLGFVLILISITAAGPFIHIVHRYYRPVPGYPRAGDRLWTILGIPWVLTGVVHSIFPNLGESPLYNWYHPLLWGSLGLACLLAGNQVWTTWISVSPDQAVEAVGPPWTNRLGLMLGVAWPLQLAACMIVVG